MMMTKMTLTQANLVIYLFDNFVDSFWNKSNETILISAAKFEVLEPEDHLTGIIGFALQAEVT